MTRIAHLLRRLTARLPRVPYRYRRVLAAVCLALAAMVTVNLFLPDGRTSPVVVAATDLAPGTSVTEADLRVAHFPVDLVPGSAIGDPADVVGRSLAAPVAQGSPVTTLGLLGSESLGTQPGKVLMPVRLADSQAAALLRPGNTIAIFATPNDSIDGEPERLLDSATVAQVGEPSESALDSSTGVLVTVMVSDEEAEALARAGQASVSFALLSGNESSP